MVDAILEATARLLKEIGFDAITTNRVADLAGVSVGSLYQYFPNKESLVSSLLRRQFERSFELIATRLVGASAEPLPELGRVYGEAVQQAWAIDPELDIILLRLAPGLSAWRKVTDLEERMADLLQDLLNERRDEIGRAPEIAGWMITRSVTLLVRDASLRRPEVLEGGQLGEEVAALFAGYLGAPAG